MVKPNALQANIRKLRFPHFLKLFSRRRNTKAGNVISFLRSSVVLRTQLKKKDGETSENMQSLKAVNFL